MQDASFLGSGWSFPPTFEGADKQLVMTKRENNINQSIDLILNTRPGERSLMPKFGSNLHQFLFQRMDNRLKKELIASVKTALLEYEPRIVVNNVKIQYVESGVEIFIDYTVRQTNSRYNHVYPFAVNEGNLLDLNQGDL